MFFIFIYTTLPRTTVNSDVQRCCLCTSKLHNDGPMMFYSSRFHTKQSMMVCSSRWSTVPTIGLRITLHRNEVYILQLVLFRAGVIKALLIEF